MPSRWQTLAVVTLQEMKDSAGLAAFADKVLAQNPKDMRLLTVLASAYSGDPEHMAKAGDLRAPRHRVAEGGARPPAPPTASWRA